MINKKYRDFFAYNDMIIKAYQRAVNMLDT